MPLLTDADSALAAPRFSSARVGRSENQPSGLAAIGHCSTSLGEFNLLDIRGTLLCESALFRAAPAPRRAPPDTVAGWRGWPSGLGPGRPRLLFSLRIRCARVHPIATLQFNGRMRCSRVRKLVSATRVA